MMLAPTPILRNIAVEVPRSKAWIGFVVSIGGHGVVLAGALSMSAIAINPGVPLVVDVVFESPAGAASGALGSLDNVELSETSTESSVSASREQVIEAAAIEQFVSDEVSAELVEKAVEIETKPEPEFEPESIAENGIEPTPRFADLTVPSKPIPPKPVTPKTAPAVASLTKTNSPMPMQNVAHALPDAPRLSSSLLQQTSYGQAQSGNPSTERGTSPAQGPGNSGTAAAVSLGGNPKPEYPAQARRRGIEGRVVLQVVVAVTGQVERVTVADSSGSKLLDRAAYQAVKRWRFQPAKRFGIATEDTITLPITFRLENS